MKNLKDALRLLSILTITFLGILVLIDVLKNG